MARVPPKCCRILRNSKYSLKMRHVPLTLCVFLRNSACSSEMELVLPKWSVSPKCCRILRNSKYSFKIRHVPPILCFSRTQHVPLKWNVFLRNGVCFSEMLHDPPKFEVVFQDASCSLNIVSVSPELIMFLRHGRVLPKWNVFLRNAAGSYEIRKIPSR
jgi:hypothetical protein